MKDDASTRVHENNTTSEETEEIESHQTNIEHNTNVNSPQFSIMGNSGNLPITNEEMHEDNIKEEEPIEFLTIEHVKFVTQMNTSVQETEREEQDAARINIA